MKVHVSPHRDLIEHDHTEHGECICGPLYEFVTGGVVVVHHSLDKREQYEASLPSTVARVRRQIEGPVGE